MRIKVGQLRQIIREVAEELGEAAEPEALKPVAAKVLAANKSDLEASAGDWVADNYDAILAKLQADPKLAAAILAAGGVNESYVGDLAAGVGDYYKGGGDILKHGGSIMGTAGGYLGAAVMAMVNDPSLIPWTELRELQLDDKIVMDGTALKGAVVGALLGHLVDVARHAKKFADRSAAATRPRRRRRP